MYDILKEPIVSVRLGSVAKVADLAQVLAWMSAGHEVAFTALQPHQHHPWHAFLVQLAALACARASVGDLPTEPETWRAALLALTAGDSAPWHLVVDDLSKPALLQPPVPEGNLDNFKTLIPTPDGLDILLTTRNFDIKAQRIVHPTPEHWLFALITKQTFEGYSGKSNYGIFRMNGGQSNRPCVAVAPDLSWARRFRRDVHVWLAERQNLLENHAYDPKGHALLWLLPWNGTDSLKRTSLDPFFIEVCRRIRLQRDGEGILARMSTSEKQRIFATEHAGATGDIWTPFQLEGKKGVPAALTVPATGFTYKKLADVLFGDAWTDWPRRRPQPDDGPTPLVIAQALVRGQGKTEGYHQRIIPIPTKARGMLARREGLERLGALSRLRIERVAFVRDRVLKPAICTLLQGATADKLDFRDQRATPWLERFEQRVDDRFFPALFDAVDADGDQAPRLAWDEELEGFARKTFFEEALLEVPVPIAHRYRVRAAAESTFYGSSAKVFEELREHRKTVKSAESESAAEV